jgi:CRISPR-associated protein Cas1
MLPFHQHHKQAEVATAQLAASAPLKKKLWQALVRRKIRNQAAHLARLDAGAGKTLAEMAKLVQAGDPANVEARAARFYWQRLYQDFTRADAEDRRNALMNYGYAIVRAALARALVAAGLLPCFGIHHEANANAFNLADDLIEPFRPFVDVMAANRATAVPDAAELTKEDRQHMAFILSAEAVVKGETVNILTASEQAAFSLANILAGKQDDLALPELRE